MRDLGRLGVAALASALVLAGSGCSPDPRLDVTLTNKTDTTIRVTGNCVADDPHSVDPGQTDNALYLGADCRIDDGDGLHGVLGCITLRHRHTDLTLSDLQPIAGPNDCWRGGDR